MITPQLFWSQNYCGTVVSLVGMFICAIGMMSVGITVHAGQVICPEGQRAISASECVPIAEADAADTPAGPTAPTNITLAKVKIDNPLSADTIEGLLRAILAVVLVFAVPIIVFFIIYAGFLYVTARGNEQTIQQANRALLYAIVGGLLILGAFVLIEIVTNLIETIAAP